MSREALLRSASDFQIGSVWAYSNDPVNAWHLGAADAIFMITEVSEYADDSTIVRCVVLDDLHVRSRYIGNATGFTLGSAMAIRSVRIM